MKSLLNGIGGGFGRSVGRVLGLIFVGFVIYTLINALGIDLSSLIPKVSIGGFNLWG